ncbi:hypothetical protein [Candidatus Clostridium stratigraminis]|uniref:hypothetical protein n=1 Tax=Candidatus Clostridium stratigraminis TaxID=3381661 RepID=UPI0038779243
MNSGANRTKINNIISKINKYKANYTKEYNSFKAGFSSAFNQKKYSSSLYIQKDHKSVFRIPGEIDILGRSLGIFLFLKEL